MIKHLLIALLLGTLPAQLTAAGGDSIRFATFNANMGLDREGELQRRLAGQGDPGLRQLAEILQRVRPDVVLLNEWDYREGAPVAELLQANYLDLPQGGQQPIRYPHAYIGPVNTGVPSGLDIDVNGATGDPADGWGFGHFPGQYGMLLLSRLPLAAERARSFRLLPWHRMPGAARPRMEDGSGYYPDSTWRQLRLSSKSHWDIPVQATDEIVIHFLASHPTPPVFDGPEDRNGARNHDEIRFWADYIEGDPDGYIVDDDGGTGGLRAGAPFVIAGDLNADPVDGDSLPGPLSRLLEHPFIDATCTPASAGGAEAARLQGGANSGHAGNPAHDTADFNDRSTGNLRADYVLPSARLEVVGCGVFWPASGHEGAHLLGFSDHRLVWVDVRIVVPDPAR